MNQMHMFLASIRNMKWLKNSKIQIMLGKRRHSVPWSKGHESAKIRKKDFDFVFDLWIPSIQN